MKKKQKLHRIDLSNATQKCSKSSFLPMLSSPLMLM